MTTQRVITLLGVALTTTLACAGHRRSPACEPLPLEFLTAGPAYPECAVARRAVPTQGARVELAEPPVGSSGCFSAEYDVVVDTTGRLVTSTARLAHTNNPAYADALKRQLNEVRYRPAEKDGQRVQQLVRYKAGVAWVTAVVPRGASRPSSAVQAPRC